ncbi:hypothetical protein EKO27_g6159 [Xylaria grammica]|uniref:Uncharacterized protein n=1 Tax=Xylaria grammica TaxID=363999 RepID=A0A439D3E5_9PEZI|nr:hypothetical protein EKO27_g6159 [Xylaria grammica]
MESQTTLVTGVSPPPPYTERADLPEAQAEAQARMQEMRTWTEHLIARTRGLDRPSPSITDALPLDLQGPHTDEPTAQGSQSSRSSRNAADEGENNDEDEKPAVMTGPSSANVSAPALDRAVPGTTDSVEISSTRCQSLKTGDAGSQKKKKKRRKDKKGKKARGRDRGGSKKGKGEGEAKSDEAQPPSQSTTGPIVRLIEKIKGLLGFASAPTPKQSASAAATTPTPSATATSTSRERRTDQSSSPEHAARMQRTDAWIDSVEHEATTICWIVVHQQETAAEAAPGDGEPGVQFVWGRDGRETEGWYRVP